MGPTQRELTDASYDIRCHQSTTKTLAWELKADETAK